MSIALPEEIGKLAEMSSGDHKLLEHVFKVKQPKKIVEIGVSAGGTTCHLFEQAPKDAVIYSVDIAKEYYRDPSKPVGYLALDFYDPARHPEWHLFPGQDICQCIDAIGTDIDFVVLDSAHLLPGELLSFIVLLPYLHEHSVLFLHDISLHMYGKLKWPGMEPAPLCFCTSLLFAAITSQKKEFSGDSIPNSGIIQVERDLVMRDMHMLINMLFLDWNYLPNPRVIALTMDIISQFYDRNTSDLVNKAVAYNLANHGVMLNKKE